VHLPLGTKLESDRYILRVNIEKEVATPDAVSSGGSSIIVVRALSRIVNSQLIGCSSQPHRRRSNYHHMARIAGFLSRGFLLPSDEIAAPELSKATDGFPASFRRLRQLDKKLVIHFRPRSGVTWLDRQSVILLRRNLFEEMIDETRAINIENPGCFVDMGLVLIMGCFGQMEILFGCVGQSLTEKLGAASHQN
jgi:hypothetical protein